MPLRSMIAPTSMKNGMAISVKLLVEMNIFCAITTSEVSIARSDAPAARPMDIAIGTPRIMKRKKRPSESHTTFMCFPPPFYQRIRE